MKTKYEKLLPFCSVDETRAHILKPFVQDGIAYVTDGRIAVWTKANESTPQTANDGAAPKMDQFRRGMNADISRYGELVWTPFPKEIPPDTRKVTACEQCGGHGYDMATRDDGTFVIVDGKKVQDECPECDGTGEKLTGEMPMLDFTCSAPHETKLARFNALFLHKIAALGGKIECAVLAPETAMRFRVDGGEFEGILMPVRKSP